MKKIIFLLITALALFSFSAMAQINLGNVKKPTTPAGNSQTGKQTETKSTNNSGQSANQTPNEKVGANSTPNSGATFYVSETTGAGSRTADGSKEKPYKDLQAAIDAAPEGSVICIAEGNYLGKMDQGYIELKKYLTIEGGWNTDFTEKNHTKFHTSIRPSEATAQAGTSGSHALMDVVVKGNRKGTVIIDGIIFDMGQYIQTILRK